MGSPEMHLEPASAAQQACQHCGGLFTPKRRWSRFCKPKCRNDFHLEKAHEETRRKIALVGGVLAHVAEQLGGEAGYRVAALDPKAVLTAAETPKP